MRSERRVRKEAVRGRQRDRAGIAPHRLRRISPACLQLIEVRRRTGHIDPRPRLCNHITRIARQRDRAARQDLAGVRHDGRRPDPDRRGERIRNRGARHIERRVRTEPDRSAVARCEYAVLARLTERAARIRTERDRPAWRDDRAEHGHLRGRAEPDARPGIRVNRCTGRQRDRPVTPGYDGAVFPAVSHDT